MYNYNTILKSLIVAWEKRGEMSSDKGVSGNSKPSLMAPITLTLHLKKNEVFLDNRKGNIGRGTEKRK